MNQNSNSDDPDQPHYGVHPVPDNELGRRITLFLPNKVLRAVCEERLSAATVKALADEEARMLKAADDSWGNKPVKAKPVNGMVEFDIERETEELQAAASSGADSLDSLAIYDVLEPLKLIQDLKGRTSDRDTYRRNEHLYGQLKAKGHRRNLAQPPEDLAELEAMRKSFPHFAAVLDLVRDQFAFAMQTGKPFVIPAILLGGDPGVGKTRFTQELARAIGSVMHRLSFDNGQTGHVFLGMDKSWGNTTYGALFELVVLGQYANPVILLDEIDKARHGREGDPLASLHTLLEPETSRRVRDLSVEMEFDASRIVWIATANNPLRIAPTLRSRFTEFWIEQPSGAQALQMAEQLALSVHAEIHLEGFEPPVPAIARFIAHLSAREQVQALKRAYVSASVAGRTCVEIRDLPEDVRKAASEFSGEETPPTGWLH